MKYQIVKRIFGISLAVCTVYGSVRGAYATVMSGMYATANNIYTESESTYTEAATPDGVAASDAVVVSETIDSTLTPSDNSSAVSESGEHIASAEQEEKKEAVLTESKSESPEEILSEPESEDQEEILPEPEPEDEEEILPEPEPEEPEISLEEYLSGLVCGACGRKCSLLHPHCRNGKHKARSAEQQYYEIYSVS